MDTTETQYDKNQRAQRRNDRNALITGLFGLALMAFGLVVAGTSTDARGGLVMMLLGAIALGAGFFNRGRKPR